MNIFKWKSKERLGSVEQTVKESPKPEPTLQSLLEEIHQATVDFAENKKIMAEKVAECYPRLVDVFEEGLLEYKRLAQARGIPFFGVIEWPDTDESGGRQEIQIDGPSVFVKYVLTKKDSEGSKEMLKVCIAGTLGGIVTEAHMENKISSPIKIVNVHFAMDTHRPVYLTNSHTWVNL
jgi:hypothetical protein